MTRGVLEGWVVVVWEIGMEMGTILSFSPELPPPVVPTGSVPLTGVMTGGKLAVSTVTVLVTTVESLVFELVIVTLAENVPAAA